jgi:hypothetical protein
MDWFRNRIDAKIAIEHFRVSTARFDSSLGQLTPVEFKQKLPSTNNPDLAIAQVINGPTNVVRSLPPSDLFG